MSEQPMDKPFYFQQKRATDHAIALLKNLLHMLAIAFPEKAVEQAVYEHPAFPFFSPTHLAQLLCSWQLPAAEQQIEAQDLQKITFPVMAVLEKEPLEFVILEGFAEGKVSYLHPASGWKTEELKVFRHSWQGVVIAISKEVKSFSLQEKKIPRQRAAIALTLVNADQTLESFIQYHLGIGFEHLFLFFDQPTEASLQIAKKYTNVTSIPRNKALAVKWQSCRLYKLFENRLQQPEARQLLNVELAIQMALEMKLDWLLQIDVDELFYSPLQSVAEHFTFLASEQITHVTYLNYEAVSDQFDIGDYFKQVTLFKKNTAHLSEAQQQILKQYSNASLNPAFLAYSNGKSAARLEAALLPWGNHLFQLRKGNLTYQKKYIPDLKALTSADFPIILHYAECGFAHFWEKYKTWADFPDTFLGGQRIIDHVPFRVQAREVVKTNNVKQIQEFYAQKVLIEDQNILSALVEKGLICRIDGPSIILNTHT